MSEGWQNKKEPTPEEIAKLAEVAIRNSFVTGFFFGMVFGMALLVYKSTANAAQLSPTIKKEARRAAAHFKLEPKLVQAVIVVESAGKVKALGTQGEIGLMQLHPRYHPNSSYNIRKNIYKGAEILSFMRKHCPYKLDKTWVICYNIGLGTKLKYPKKHPYYKKVMRRYARLR